MRGEVLLPELVPGRQRGEEKATHVFAGYVGRPKSNFSLSICRFKLIRKMLVIRVTDKKQYRACFKLKQKRP